jgi:phosphoglycolate phosphatase-like HAD superfamily hydrolase
MNSFFLTSAKKKINVKLLILDCDGIIFNSNNLKTNAYRETLKNLNVSAKGIDDFVKLHLSDVSVSRFVKFRTFFKEVYTDLSHNDEAVEEQLVEKALNGYSEQCLILYSKLKPVKQAIQLAQKIPFTYVISGGAQTELNHVFQEHDISKYFKEILGSPITKPEHLKYVFDQTGCGKDDTLFIGDGYTDFKTSREYDINFCFLEQMSDWKKNVEQMKGYEHNVTRCKHWDDIIQKFEFNDDIEDVDGSNL